MARNVRELENMTISEGENGPQSSLLVENGTEDCEKLISDILPGALELLRTLQGHLHAKQKSIDKDSSDDKSLGQDNSEQEAGERIVTDALYFYTYEKLLALHEYQRIVRLRLADQLFDPEKLDEKENPKLVQPHVAASLKNLSKLLKTTLDELVERERLKPRIVRLATRLKLSDPELRAFIFIIFFCTGITPDEDTGWFAGRSTLQKWRDWSHFESTAQMLSFLSPTREHFKTGLIDSYEEFAANYAEVSFRVPRAVLKALYGATMDVEEALSFAKTPLAEVLAEEPGAVVGEFKEKESSDLKEKDSWPKEKAPKEKAPQEEDRDKERTEVDMNMNKLMKQLGSFTGGSFVEKLRMMSQKEREAKENAPEAVVEDKRKSGKAADDINSDTDGKIQAFTDDLDYLEEGFEVVVARVRIYNTNEKEEEPYITKGRNRESVLRELEAKERQALSRFHRRLKLTRARPDNAWLPRLERLVDLLGLNDFERFVVLSVVGVVLSQAVSRAFRALPRYPPKMFDVTMLLTMNTTSLNEQIQMRKYFYPDSKLVSSGIIRLIEPISRRKNSSLSDLASITVEIDRRMLDYVCGLDTELNELLSCVRCYTPSENIDSVVLPEETKKLLVQTAESFDTFKRLRHEVGFDDIVKYGKGLIILLFGEPGTGKTLFANALAGHLGKRMLSVQFAMMEQSSLDSEGFRVLFREAAIQDAIIFFDECESLFEGRGSRSSVSLALRELERYNGIMILTTNRPHDLDHAMHRRITLAIEFSAPDAALRREIWLKHVPKRMKMKDVDYTALAIEHELTGGFIKNAILQAMSMGVIEARDTRKLKSGDRNDCEDADIKMEDIEITMDMLRKACRLQARGRLRMTDLARRVIPKQNFEDLVLPEAAMVQLKDCAMSEKVRGVLASRWGFKNDKENGRANVVLLHGPKGCGKSLCALALGYEVGRPVQKFSASEVLRRKSEDVHAMFADAAVSDAVIVIEQVELLFASLSGVGDSSADEALYHIISFPGLIVLCCTTAPITSVAGWPKFMPFPELAVRCIRYIVEIPNPDKAARLKLWRISFPKETPISKDVDSKLDEIAEDFKFSGSTIASCARRAASMAALRDIQKDMKEAPKELSKPSVNDTTCADKQKAFVTIDDIVHACETEMKLLKLADRGFPEAAIV